MTLVTAQYPGRVCLLGEHCDWAGGSSLAVPLDRGIEASAAPEPGSDRISVVSEFGGDRHSERWDRTGVEPGGSGPLRFVGAAIAEVAARGVELPGASVRFTSDLPAGRGFSSSAAICLTAVDVLSRLGGVELTREQLVEWAFTTERVRLGVECGRLDPIACTSPGPVRIRWPHTAEDPPDVHVLSVRCDAYLLYAAFPSGRDTRAILEALNRDHAAGGSATHGAIEIFTRMTEAGADALEAGDAPRLGAAMDAAQDAYETLLEAALPALAAPALRRATRLLRDAGALGAKFSGAGGDGSVVALFTDAHAAAPAAQRLRGEGMTVAGMPLSPTD